MASKYVQGHTPNVLKFHGSRTAADSCQHFLHLLQPNYSILDVGCGPGSITADLALLVPEGKIVGVDASETAINAASARQDLPSNCTFHTADAMNLPYPDATFDVVQTSQLLCHLSDPVGAMKEFRRVCKEGGFVACREGDIGSMIVHPRHPGLDLSAKIQPIVMSGHGASPDAGRKLVQWALDAGFTDDKLKFTAGHMTAALESREFHGKIAAARVREDHEYRRNAMKHAGVSERDLDLMVEGWEAFAADKAGVFSLICGQIVCFK